MHKTIVFAASGFWVGGSVSDWLTNQALRDKSILGNQNREMCGSGEKELLHPEQSVLV